MINSDPKRFFLQIIIYGYGFHSLLWTNVLSSIFEATIVKIIIQSFMFKQVTTYNRTLGRVEGNITNNLIYLVTLLKLPIEGERMNGEASISFFSCNMT